MIMEQVLSATEVRGSFSSFVDSVVREKPIAVRRNRDVFMSLSLQHLTELISSFKFAVEHEQEEDGSFVGSIQQIPDIIGAGETYEDFVEDMAYQLIDYAKDYYNDFIKYYNSPNRRSHLPFVLNVLIAEDIEGVKQLIIDG